jgi:hypothetical protein
MVKATLTQSVLYLGQSRILLSRRTMLHGIASLVALSYVLHLNHTGALGRFMGFFHGLFGLPDPNSAGKKLEKLLKKLGK